MLLQFIAIFSGIVSVISGLIAIYDLFTRRTKDARWVAVVFSICTAILIVVSLILLNTSSSPSNNAPNATKTPTTSQVGTVTPMVQQSPSPTLPPSPTFAPTSIPSLTPTAPQAGTLLYSASWSSGMNGWGGPSDWQAANSILTNNGQQGSSISLAPYSPGDNGIANYAVEAQIQFLRYSDAGAFGGLDSFGILVRSPDGQKGYLFAACASAGIDNCGSSSHEIYISNGSQNFAEYAYQPNQNEWHTYRLEVKGNIIRLLIDGRPFLNSTDNTYLDGGQIGLMSNRCQISVRSFKVFAL